MLLPYPQAFLALGFCRHEVRIGHFSVPHIGKVALLILHEHCKIVFVSQIELQPSNPMTRAARVRVLVYQGSC